MPTRNELWTKVQQLLQKNLSKPSYETWIRPAEFFDFKDGFLTLLAPNSFSSDWLRKNYSHTIEEIASEVFGSEVKVYINVKDCLLYTSPSPRDKRQSRMPSSA